MVIRDSTESPLVLGLEVAPDWGAEVFMLEEFHGDTLKRTLTGVEQRISNRPKPGRSQRYSVASSRLANHADLIATLTERARSPLLVPWWGEGLRISVNMPSANALELEIAPGVCHDITPGSRVLVGAHPREVAAISGRNLTLVADVSGIAEPAGTWVFPMRLAVLSDTSGALAALRHDAFAQSLQFTEI